jgi:hypothetical protein
MSNSGARRLMLQNNALLLYVGQDLLGKGVNYHKGSTYMARQKTGTKREIAKNYENSQSLRN